MPSAPGSSCPTRAKLGSVNAGSACGMVPTVATPDAGRLKNHEAAIPAATTNSGADECGFSRSATSRATSAAAATATVISDASGTCCARLTMSWKKPRLAM